MSGDNLDDVVIGERVVVLAGPPCKGELAPKRRETSAALKARPLVLARGVKGAHSGGKLRSVQLLRIYNPEISK